MTPFARLLEALAFTPGRNAKLTLLREYLARTPDPDRGWALAALTGELDLPHVKAGAFRELAESRVDPVLFRLSYDFVGDLAETVSLIWPAPEAPGDDRRALRLGAVVDTLRATGRAERLRVLEGLLDALGPSERFALVKLCTGGLRVGVSARLARTALAGERSLEEIEALWPCLTPPYVDLFAWLEGGPAPNVDRTLAFRPMMLAHPVEARLYAAAEMRENLDNDAETLSRLIDRLDPADWAAEWKWDGVRVQAVAAPSGRALYSRTGEDYGPAFPDVLDSLNFTGCLDGELLVRGTDGAAAPFSELQKRLGRKRVTAKEIAARPAFIRVYDLLQEGDADLRAIPFAARRARLEAFAQAHGLDLSPAVPFDDWPALAALRAGARDAAQEGLMLKRRDGAYLPGRQMGEWFKWKRAPLTADCVLMYAQRGHGKRSSFYSDYTFGAWTEGPDGPLLTPVGKAYSGFTDAELTKLDKFVRDNTTDRFGPVRAVRPTLVLEIAFDAVQRSTRHKSGVAMRFPRIKRIRWDKPAAEAERLDTLAAWAA
jgi:DNA ligase-1